MKELVFTEEDYSNLLKWLDDPRFESCAILSTNVIRTDRVVRMLVRQIQVAPPDAYRKRNTSTAILDPAFLVPIVKTAKNRGNSLVFVHTHPWESGIPIFSPIDDAGEHSLKEFLDRRGLDGPHAALVFGKSHCRARLLATHEEINVITLGDKRSVNFECDTQKDLWQIHDRQIRLLGSNAQRRLGKLLIAIVGLGGTGSVVAQQLAYLGIENFTFIDPDLVEETNLNRLVGGKAADIGIPKVLVAARHVREIASHAKVTTIKGSILDHHTAQFLTDVDFIFSCTDTQASRAVINQLAYQYLIPCIDMGVSITSGTNSIQRITGRVQLLSPGHACLTCQELLDSNVVRQEFMTPEQRVNDPYFVGPGEPQPAVISLNSTMSSLATTMFLAVAADLPSKARQLTYDAVIGRVRTSAASKHPTCVVCSRFGALGRGNEWSLPVRIATEDELSK